MAFQNKNLSVLTYANGFTLWHYTTPDSLDEIKSSGYFNIVGTLMNTGDIIIINAMADTSIMSLALHSNNGEPVVELQKLK